MRTRTDRQINALVMGASTPAGVKALAALEERGVRVHADAHGAQLAGIEGVLHWVRVAAAEDGRLDTLVIPSNLGVGAPTSTDALEGAMRKHIARAVAAVRAARPYLRASECAHVVLLGANEPGDGWALSDDALGVLAQVLRQELHDVGALVSTLTTMRA